RGAARDTGGRRGPRPVSRRDRRRAGATLPAHLPLVLASRRGDCPAGRSVRPHHGRRVTAGRDHAARRRAVELPAARAGPNRRRVPALLVAQFDAVALGPTGVGVRAVARPPALRPPNLLGAAASGGARPGPAARIVARVAFPATAGAGGSPPTG